MAPAHRTAPLAVLAILLFATWAAGCGGSNGEGGTTPAEGGDKTPVKLDQEFSSYEPIALTGVYFQPEALGRPGMLRVKPKRKITLARARRRAARKRRSPVDVQILATLLWVEADKQASSDKDGAKQAGALRTEVLELLREEHARTGDKTGAITLQMLASAEMWGRDFDKAAAVYQELLDRFADQKEATTWKTWLAFLHLRAGRLDEAAALTADWKLDDADSLAAYVMAWVALRRGDADAARAAMVKAAKSWRGPLTRSLQGELLLFLARTGASVEEADAVLTELAGDKPELRYGWLYQLSEAYKGAGRYQAASDALDVVIDKVMAGRDVPPDDYVGFRFRQADYQFRLNRPARAADLAIEADEGLKKCDAQRCPPTVRESVRDRLQKLAVFYHTTYHSTLDDRYYGPAKKLYEHLIALDRPDKEKTRANLTNLDDTKARANPANGKHDQKLMLDMVMTRTEVASACYEWVMQGDPKLDGSVKLNLEVTDEGEVRGSSTEPAAGEEGMAAVGACLLERARAWSFPGRTAPGVTTLVLPFAFSAEPPPAPAPATQPSSH